MKLFYLQLRQGAYVVKKKKKERYEPKLGPKTKTHTGKKKISRCEPNCGLLAKTQLA